MHDIFRLRHRVALQQHLPQLLKITGLPSQRSSGCTTEGGRHFGQAHPLGALMQPFKHPFFAGDLHDHAADARRYLLGWLNVSMVPVVVNRPVPKHSSKLVYIGATLHQSLLANLPGGDPIVGVNGGVEVRASDFHGLVPESVYRCRACGERKEIAGGVPGPCAEARSLFGQSDAFLDNPVRRFSRLAEWRSG
jgi:hypothetical protein